MTKPKDGQTKDLSTHILMCVLLCITFISLLGGLIVQTSAFYNQKSQIAKLEIRNLDLKIALLLSDLQIKWLKREIQKQPKKKPPKSFRSI